MGHKGSATRGILRTRKSEAALPALAVVPYFTFEDGVLRPDFADCVTLRVTQTLQSVNELHVTAPSSTINLARNLTVQEIGRRLNVDYVLRGQILRSEQTLYFTQWLYEVASGNLILQVESECGLGQLEGFDRDILARVIADIRLPLQENEVDRIMSMRPRNLSAYELAVRAQVAIHRMDRRNFALAKRQLVKALTLDPSYATAYAWLARHHSIRIGQGWSPAPRDEAREAMRLAEIAIRLDDENAVALATAGHLHSYLHLRYKEGERLLRRAIKACPNEPLGWLLLSATLSYTGRADEAREHAEYALSLSPLDSCLYSFYIFAALSCYSQGDYEQAVHYARQAADLNEGYSSIYKLLALSLVGLGEISEAREAAAKLRSLEPTYTQEVAARTLPFQDRVLRETSLLRLRTAGCFDAVEPTRRRRSRRA
jgi:adenylate cyclase